MLLKLVKSNNIYDSAKFAIRELNDTKSDLSKKQFIVVPDRFSLIAEKMVFTELNIDATFNIEVLGINRLAQKIINEQKSELRERVLNGVQVQMLVQKAILKSKDSFTFFPKTLGSAAFSESIKNTIIQLKTSRVSPESLKNVAVFEPLKSKLNDIANIYSNYESEQKGDKLDSGDLIDTFVSLIPSSNMLKNAIVVFAGFDSMTSQGINMVKVVMSNAEKVVFGLCLPEQGQKNAFVYDFTLKNDLLEMAKDNEAEIQEVDYIQNDGNGGWLAKNVFAGKTEKRAWDGFSLTEFADINQEINALAKEIRYDVVFNGRNYSDFNIAVSDFTTYKSAIEKVFNEYEIPLFLDVDTTLYDCQLSKFLLSYFDLIKTGLSKDSFINFISYPFVRISQKAREMLINHISIFKREKEALLSELEFEYENKEEIEKQLSEIICLLKNKLFTNKKTATYSFFIETIRNIISDFNINITLEEQIEKRRENAELKEQTLLSSLDSKYVSMLESMEKITCDEKIRFEDFAKIFESGLKGVTLSSPPLSCDSVFVGDATTSFFTPCKTLFMIGVNSDSLPAYSIDCGLISDSDIEALDKYYRISPSIEKVNFRNRLKLISLFTSGFDKLWCSYQKVTTDSKNRFPSLFIEDVLHSTTNKNGLEMRVQKPISLSSIILTNKDFDNNKIAKDLSTINNSKKELIKLIKINKNSQKILKNSIYFSLRNKLTNNFNEINRFNLNNELIIIKNANKLFFKNGTTKISQLETFANCPYSHFAKYGLNLQEEKNIDMLPKDVGTLLHSGVELFCKRFVSELRTMSDEKIDEASVKIFEEIEKSLDGKFFNKGLASKKRMLKKEFASICKAVCMEQRSSNFTPVAFEKFFKGELSFFAGDEKIDMVGVVDRIDEHNGDFRIIDYKSGNCDYNKSDFFFGTKIQLVVYANAYSKLSNKRPVGVFYFPVSDKMTKAKKQEILKGYLLEDVNIVRDMDNMLGEEKAESNIIKVKLTKDGGFNKASSGALIESKKFENILKYSMEIASSLINDISSGLISPCPICHEQDKPCRYCSAKYMCHFDSINGSVARKKVAQSEIVFDEVDNGGI